MLKSGRLTETDVSIEARDRLAHLGSPRWRSSRSVAYSKLLPAIFSSIWVRGSWVITTSRSIRQSKRSPRYLLKSFHRCMSTKAQLNRRSGRRKRASMKPYAQQRQWYDRLYKKQRWRNRSAHQLKTHPLCAICLSKAIVTAANISDHVVPHRGDPQLFWFGALQSLCPSCHSSSPDAARIRDTSTISGAMVGLLIKDIQCSTHQAINPRAVPSCASRVGGA